MQRRGFLFGLAAGFAAPAIVRADSLMKLFVPKAELIVPRGNQLLTATEIAREATRLYNAVFLTNPDIQYNEDIVFVREGERIGRTLRIRTPQNISIQWDKNR